jgi:hypothetical protein
MCFRHFTVLNEARASAIGMCHDNVKEDGNMFMWIDWREILGN